ncbi:MAG: DUF2520 domain-containing protein [Acidobacteria bacterium]|nr:DUF2520 domain-containing protein [Acidobacteriota bacterium]
MDQNKISIIGAGKTGSSLGHWLKNAGFKIGGVITTSLHSAKRAVSFIGEGIPSVEPLEAIGDAGIIIIGTPDRVISSIASSLAQGDIEWKGRFIFHLSGATSFLVLSPLAEKGAVVGSLHPLLSFAKPLETFAQFGGCFFALAGAPEAVEKGKLLVEKMGGKFLLIPEEAKPLYHSAASIASNFLVVLINISLALFQSCGIKKEEGERALLPLLRSTLANVEGVGAVGALTGPIVRGDERTVESHLKAIKDHHPEFIPLYREAASFALSLSYQNRLLDHSSYCSLLSLLKEL